jgi:hypothetical protein
VTGASPSKLGRMASPAVPPATMVRLLQALAGDLEGIVRARTDGTEEVDDLTTVAAHLGMVADILASHLLTEHAKEGEPEDPPSPH